MKKQRRDLTKKEFVTIMAVGISMALLAVALMFVAAIWQEDSTAWIWGGCGFATLILDVCILLPLYPQCLRYEANVKMKKLHQTPCQRIEGVTREKVEAFCRDRNYRLMEPEGYYYKRILSFTHDYVNFYVKCADMEDLDSQANDGFRFLCEADPKKHNKCLVLVLFADEICQETLNELTTLSSFVLLGEHLLPPALQNRVVVPFLVDCKSGEAYYAPEKKHGISMYKNGVKLMKKIADSGKLS